MDEKNFWGRQFEANRAHLRAVAYRMLGSTGEVDDAVQEAWLRLGRSDAGEVENLRGWLTTVVARICLDMLRARKTRREEPMGPHTPEPSIPDAHEHDAEMADSVGAALLVVLETLAPAERLAFVLHDMFAVPFEEIAPIVGRTPAAARQLASRARRRVQGTPPIVDDDLDHKRRIVDAFLAAWCFAPTRPRCGSARSPKSGVPRRWPGPSRAARRPQGRPWRTARWRLPSSSVDGFASCCGSPLPATGFRASRRLRMRRALAIWTWRCWNDEAAGLIHKGHAFCLILLDFSGVRPALDGSAAKG